MANVASGAGVAAAVTASPAPDMAGRPSLGDGLAADLCSAVSAAVCPKEDVKGYLEAVLLPALGSAIESLLHHIHESGELRRALHEQRDAERKALEDQKPPEYGSPRSQSGSPGAASVGKEDADDFEEFDPLLWLAQTLQESAALPSGMYREKVEAIVQAELEAAAAAATAAAAAGENEDGEPSGIEDIVPTPTRASVAGTPTRASDTGGLSRAGGVGRTPTPTRSGSMGGRAGR